jgi:hypothetical protein
MTDKTDDTGKGPQKPGEGPRRPHATIDLKATEVGGGSRAGSGAARENTRAGAVPPPGAAPKRSAFADRLAAMRRLGRSTLGSNTFLSHVAAGVAGAVVTLVVGGLFGLWGGGSPGGQSVPVDVGRRLAAIERKAAQLPAASNDVADKLAATEARVKTLEERTANVTALANEHAKLAARAKALESRVGSPEVLSRLAKLETSMAALASSGKAGNGQPSEALSNKLAELEKLATEAGEAARSATQRMDRDLAGVRTEAARLGQRLDGLKTEVEAQFKGAARSSDLAPVMSKLAAFEKDLQGFVRGETDRSANATRVLLTLELANLKRAMDRGDRYAAELEAVKQAAGGALKLTALERHKLDGVQTQPELAKQFRAVANAAIDAETEPADASVLDRLVAGAKGIVRVRKAGHDPSDTSVEAVTGRMEAALSVGRLGEVLAQGKTLPPTAALAAEDWLRKVEARYAVDQAMAEIEAGLKSSLARPAEPKR